MIKFSSQNNRGFTLMETVIYIALFGILMSGAVTSAWSLLESGGKNKNAMAIQEEGTFLNRKINWALTGASDVDVDGTGKILTVTRPDLLTDSPLLIESTGETVMLKRGTTGTPTQLSGDFLKIKEIPTKDFFIVLPASGGRPPSVEVNFSVNGTPFIFKTYLRQ